MHPEPTGGSDAVFAAFPLLTMVLRPKVPLSLRDWPGVTYNGPYWDNRFGVWRCRYAERIVGQPGFLSVNITLDPRGLVSVVFNDHSGVTTEVRTSSLPPADSHTLSVWAKKAFEKVGELWTGPIADHLCRVKEEAAAAVLPVVAAPIITAVDDQSKKVA